MTTKDEMQVFFEQTIAKLKQSDDFVAFFENPALVEFGNLLDCFECTINQRWACELTCGDFKVDDRDVFQEVPKEKATYILNVLDYRCELYSGVRSRPEGPSTDYTLCFSGYDTAKQVLRDLVSLYSADGV